MASVIRNPHKSGLRELLGFIICGITKIKEYIPVNLLNLASKLPYPLIAKSEIDPKPICLFEQLMVEFQEFYNLLWGSVTNLFTHLSNQLSQVLIILCIHPGLPY